MTTILTRDRDLAEFVQRACETDVLALDTEFMRERTYYPELCLIQAASADELVLIDPLADLDLSPLEQLFSAGPSKILHACRQDLEVLNTRFARPLNPVFDTQLAAAFCGYAAQWSYANLVEEFAGVSLPKGATRSNWAQRPLTEHQLAYAADDVRYLIAARETLLEKLDALGRMSWFEEDMQALQQAPVDVDPAEAWRRVKGYGSLAGAGLARLQALAAWRENLAIASDKPRRWVVDDVSLLALAAAGPASKAKMAALSEVPDWLVRKHATSLLALMEQASEAQAPVLDDRMPDKALMKRLRKQLLELAESLHVDASVLATRSDLESLALNGRCARIQQGWREQVVSQPLLQALNQA